MAKITDIKTDRMRYTKNSTSATLAYLSIVFNAIYFISVYNTDVKNYYYNLEIGVSVVYNLLFMLFVFLASEGVKSYDLKYSYVLAGIGAMQIVRILGIPLTAYFAFIEVKKGEYIQAMELNQFLLCTICLVLSAGCAIAGGIIAYQKTTKLRKYEKTLVSE